MIDIKNNYLYVTLFFLSLISLYALYNYILLYEFNDELI